MSQSENKLALPVGTVLQQYQILKVLGAGAFGIVYMARHIRLELLVAVKEYLPSFLATREGDTVHPLTSADESEFRHGIKGFLEEARQLVKFDEHPNVVKCRDFFEDNGTAYLVMNFVEGQEFAEILKIRREQKKPLSETQILRVMIPILSGLKDIHDLKVLHRDIKPANIFIRRDNEQPVLIDFGAAKKDFNTEKTKVAMYTPGYAPMEQVSSSGKLGPWTDLYAMGAMMWRIVADKNPPKVEMRYQAILNDEPDPLTPAVELGKGRYSMGFLAAIDKALKIKSDDRFQNATDFIQALKSGAVHTSANSSDDEEPLTIKDPNQVANAANLAKVNINIPQSATSTKTNKNQQSAAPVSNVQAAVEPANKSRLLIIVAASLALIAGIVLAAVFMLSKDNRPSEELIFSKIERMYENSNRAQANLDLKEGLERDIKQLEIMADQARTSGDTEDYQDTLGQISRAKSKLQEYILAVRHAETDRINTAMELAQYRKEMPSYIDDCFEKKVKQAQDQGNPDKANLVNGLFLKVKDAAGISSESEIKTHLTQELKLEE